MTPLYLLTAAAFLGLLNHYCPNRNAAFGLRFPQAFKSKEKWQAAQADFYLAVILSNLSLICCDLFYKATPSQLNGLSFLTIIGSACFSYVRTIFRNKG